MISHCSNCRAEAPLHPPFLENNFYLHFVGYNVSFSGTIVMSLRTTNG